MRRPTPSVRQGNSQTKEGRTPAKGPTPEVRSATTTVVGSSDPRKRDATLADVRQSIEPLLKLSDLAATLNASSRTIERLRSAGKLPRPDLLLGIGSRKSPRWKPRTIRAWIEQGGAK